MRVFALFAFFAILTLFSSPVIAQQSAPVDEQILGRCIPLRTHNYTKSALEGFTQPVCQNILAQAGASGHFVTEKDVPIGSLTGECVNDAVFSRDLPVKQVTNFFTATQPSPLCQQILTTAMCLGSYLLCGASGVVVEPYLPFDYFLPCRWLCDMLMTTNELCNDADRDYLRGFGLDLDATDHQVPELKCDSAPWSSEKKCFSPSTIYNQTVAPICEPYTGSFCSSVFGTDSSIYLPPAVSQGELEQAVAQLQPRYNGFPRTDTKCAEHYTTLNCQSVFQQCIDIGVQKYPYNMTSSAAVPGASIEKTAVALPLLPSLSSCTNFHHECEPLPYFQWQDVDQKFPNCADAYIMRENVCFPDLRDQIPLPDDPELSRSIQAQQYTDTKLNLIKKVRANYMLNQKTYLAPYEYVNVDLAGPEPVLGSGNEIQYRLRAQSFAATVYQFDPSLLPYPQSCPSPLVSALGVKEEIEGRLVFNGRCSVPCLNPAFSKSDHTTIEAVSLVFVIFSLIFSGLLAITFIFFKSQRHKRILLWYVLSYFGAAVMLLLGLVVNGSSNLYPGQCETDIIPYHMKGFALFQSIFLVYFLLASSAWWNMNATDLFLRLILNRQYRRGSQADQQRMLAMHLFCWLLPLVCVVALLVGHMFGYDSYLPIAWITSDLSMTSEPVPLFWIFFMLPILALATIGLAFVAVIVLYLIRYDATGGLKKFHDKVERQKNLWFKIQQSTKLLGFVFLMLVFIVLVVINQADLQAHKHQWAESSLQWAREVMVGGPNPHLEHMSASRVILFMVGLSSPGWIMFLLYFVFTADVYGLWAGLCYYKLGISCCQSLAKEDTATGSGTDSQGSSQGSSQGTHSADLLTGEARTLKTNKSGTQTQVRESEFEVPSTATAQSSQSTPPAIKDAATNQPPAKPVVSKREQSQRRATLFKGFKNKAVHEYNPSDPIPHNPAPLIEMTSQDVGCEDVQEETGDQTGPVYAIEP